MRDLREEIATARSFSPVSSGYSRRSGNRKAVRAAVIVASQQRQRLFDVPSKVSLLSDRSARGCVSAAIFAGTTKELGIALILLSAVLGAMLCSTIGLWIGARYSEARFEEKLAVTRASEARHSSIRFVAGELNPIRTREGAGSQCGGAGRGFDHGRVRARRRRDPGRRWKLWRVCPMLRLYCPPCKISRA
jgi:hypothetical protein